MGVVGLSVQICLTVLVGTLDGCVSQVGQVEPASPPVPPLLVPPEPAARPCSSCHPSRLRRRCSACPPCSGFHPSAVCRRFLDRRPGWGCRRRSERSRRFRRRRPCRRRRSCRRPQDSPRRHLLHNRSPLQEARERRTPTQPIHAWLNGLVARARAVEPRRGSGRRRAVAPQGCARSHLGRCGVRASWFSSPTTAFFVPSRPSR